MGDGARKLLCFGVVDKPLSPYSDASFELFGKLEEGFANFSARELRRLAKPPPFEEMSAEGRRSPKEGVDGRAGDAAPEPPPPAARPFS